MDSSAAFFNKVLADFVVQRTAKFLAPAYVITLLALAFISILIDKLPTRTILGAHFTIFIFASVGGPVSTILSFKILAYAVTTMVALKFVGRFFSWLGEKEEAFGPRLVVLGILTIFSLIILGTALDGLGEFTKDPDLVQVPIEWK
jgi:hypothetical protein